MIKDHLLSSIDSYDIIYKPISLPHKINFIDLSRFLTMADMVEKFDSATVISVVNYHHNVSFIFFSQIPSIS